MNTYLLKIFIILDHIGSTNGSICHTDYDKEHSPEQGKPCVFPWIDPWKLERHDGCSNPYPGPYTKGKWPKLPWCPTKVLENGLYDINTNHYGVCNKKCLETGKYDF